MIWHQESQGPCSPALQIMNQTLVTALKMLITHLMSYKDGCGFVQI